MQNFLRNKAYYYLKNLQYKLQGVQCRRQNKGYLKEEIVLKDALLFSDFETLSEKYKKRESKESQGKWQVEKIGLGRIYTYYLEKPVVQLKFSTDVLLADIIMLEKEKLLDPFLKKIICEKIHEVSFSNPEILEENLYYFTSLDNLLNLLTSGISKNNLSINDLKLLAYIAMKFQEEKYSRLNIFDFKKIVACLFECDLDKITYQFLGWPKAKIYIGTLDISNHLVEKEYMPEIVLGNLYIHDIGKSIDKLVCPKIVCGDMVIKQKWIEHLILPEVSLGFMDIEDARYLKEVKLPRLLFDGIRFQKLREISMNYPLIFPSVIWGGMYFPSLNSKENIVMPQVNHGEFQLREEYVCHEENWEEVQKKEKNCTLKELESKILAHELSRKKKQKVG